MVVSYASARLDCVLFSPSQMYHQKKFLQSKREPAAWADIADDGRERTQLHSVPMFTQLVVTEPEKGGCIGHFHP